jgi:chromosome segregation ATPase
MAKRTASPAQVNDPLSDSARKNLLALRGEIESRLATLEEVLADPSRGESLAGLILDLSRIATEEAQAAAAQACLATRTEADKQIEEHRTAAAAALEALQASLRTTQQDLETERATTQELQHEAKQTRLELEKQTALGAARAQLERDLQSARDELGREKKAVSDLKRSAAEAVERLEAERRGAAETQSQLAAERSAVADLRGAADDARENLERATERLATLEQDLADARAAAEQERQEARAAQEQAVREAVAVEQRALAHAEALHDRAQADARAAYDAISQDLERERTAAAYAHAELQSQIDGLQSELDEQRTQTAGLREAAQRVDELTTSLDRERAAAADRERTASEERDRVYSETQSQVDSLVGELDAERQRTNELRQALREAEERQASFDRESSQTDAERGELEARQRELAALSQAALAEAQRALSEAQADLERERDARAELLHASESADQQLASSRSNEVQMLAHVDQLTAQLEKERGEASMAIEALIAERDSVRGELQTAQKWIEDLHAAEAEFTSRAPVAAQARATSPSPSEAVSPSVVEAPAVETVLDTPAAIAADEVWQELRLASRHYFIEAITVQINGDAGTLFDLSITGCQLLSPSALKPNQTIKIQLPGESPIHCSGKVVWTRLESAAGAQLLSYRAGVRFTKADAGAIESFTAAHATSPVPVVGG